MDPLLDDRRCPLKLVSDAEPRGHDNVKCENDVKP